MSCLSHAVFILTPIPQYLPPSSPPGLHRAMSMMSFENLVALANDQERIKEARQMVWRVKGQPVVELDDVESCLKHAAVGGLRSATLAFNIRAAFNLVLACMRLRSLPKKKRLPLLVHAIFGTDTWRFAAMFGSFTSIYKFLLNALPILLPETGLSSRRLLSSSFCDEEMERLEKKSLELAITSDTRRRHTTRLSLSVNAQKAWVRKKTRRWHAAFAGAVAGGIAVLFETSGRRVTIGQQMFVRGLQGTFNAYTTAKNIKIPHGDVILFALINGQILYANFLRPDSLNRGYHNWFVRVSEVPPEAYRINRDLMRTHSYNPNDLDKLIANPKYKMTPRNTTTLLAHKDAFFNGASDPSKYLADSQCPCKALHPGQTSCWHSKFMLPVYGALHFLPPVLFRTKAFMKNPLRILLKSAMGTARSCTFLGVFVVIYQTAICLRSFFHEFFSSLPINSMLKLPQWLVDAMFVSRAAYFIPGLASGLRRRAELSMYVLPKALESFWRVATGKVPGGVRVGKTGETLVGRLSLCFRCTYQNDPQHLSGLVRRILYQFIGPN
ncbi:hypothetical protein IW261DRAFT_1523426 [Armillaria novae-zelandiae]|uniref:Transmembrane protein 135 N-terminal domain-containing protein n=1 Tax=Armillaria novae-zelandiae TaxID=153914 RepID=A0AA39NHB7_9AGAR|nr:hypothetical protein IW261DRAFT_1523426 [Armillaria novae-zelandiae]